MNKISGLNYIRAISAVLIMLYHYTTRYSDVFYKTIYESNHIGVWWGCWAVAVFFVISGFLTVYNVNEDTKLTGFLKKRFVRLYPAYWGCVIITTITVVILCDRLFCGILPTMVNFTMLQGFIGISNVDGAYWTLRYELLFYIFIAMVLLVRWNKYIDVLCTIWEIVIIILISLTQVVNINNLALKLISFVAMPQHAPMFIAGVSLCYIHKRHRTKISLINLVLAVIIWLYNRTVEYMFFVGAVLLMIYIFAETKFSFKYDKLLIWIAKISYPLYLIHQYVGYAIIYRFDILKIDRCYGIILSICVSVIIAYLVHRFIEKPVMRLAKRFAI